MQARPFTSRRAIRSIQKRAERGDLEPGWRETEQAYKNIPLYPSSKGYGVFVNHSEEVDSEVGREKCSKLGISVRGKELEYFIIGGGSMKAVSVSQWLPNVFDVSVGLGELRQDDRSPCPSSGLDVRALPIHLFHHFIRSVYGLRLPAGHEGSQVSCPGLPSRLLVLSGCCSRIICDADENPAG